ncbi:small GTPase superfamily, Rab type, partial [Kipferlia bialata]
QLNQYATEQNVICICGNKTDMEDKREVDGAVARAYANEIGAIYLETSAKTANNVGDLFVQTVQNLPSLTDEDSESDSPIIARQEESGCGC